MGNITTSNLTFKPASIVYSKVKRRLKSLGIAGTIDEGEFPTYTKEALNNLGLGVLKESEAIIEIVNSKACLPNDFRYIYSVYKCSPDFVCDNKTRKHIQNSSFSYTTEITDQIAITNNSCEFNCCADNNGYVESVWVNTYVLETPSLSFNNFRPLTLNTNVGSSMPSSYYIGDFNIIGKTIYTGFTDDFVYIKYYGFPIDAEGELLVPDVQQIETAVEWYIIYQTLLSLWFDGSVPDIQNKWQVAEQKYNEGLAEAKYNRKLPAFSEMVGSIREQRAENTLHFFSGQYFDSNFQRNS